MEAVQHCGLALRYVKDQTVDMALAAYRDNHESVDYISKSVMNEIRRAC